MWTERVEALDSLHLPYGQASEMAPFLFQTGAFRIEMGAFLWYNGAIFRHCPRYEVSCSRHVPALDMEGMQLVHKRRITMERKTSSKATVRANATAGTFQAILAPAEVIKGKELVERLARYSNVQPGQARIQLTALEGFILDMLAQGNRLDFGLVSFYPRLSGALSSRDIDPEQDGLFVRGAVKATRTLMNALKGKVHAVNAPDADAAVIDNVFDRDASTFEVIAADHVISISGQNIQINPERDDEGAWLVKRRHINKRKHAYEVVARAHVRKSDGGVAEVVFPGPLPRGKCLLEVRTRRGKGADFKVVICRHEIRVA